MSGFVTETHYARALRNTDYVESQANIARGKISRLLGVDGNGANVREIWVEGVEQDIRFFCVYDVFVDPSDGLRHYKSAHQFTREQIEKLQI